LTSVNPSAKVRKIIHQKHHMTKIEYRTVLSEGVPALSTHVVPIRKEVCSKGPTTPLKPFKIFIDDKMLEVPDYEDGLFSGFEFVFNSHAVMVKTLDSRFIVIYLNPPGRNTEAKKWELFTTHGECLFEDIIDINCGHGLRKVYAFCVKKYNTDTFKARKKYERKIFFHESGWEFTGEYLDGLSPKVITIKQPEELGTEQKFEISELFGPFPLSANYDYRYSRNPWWVALCNDDKYRILQYNYGLMWATTKDKKQIEEFKRFIPLPKANHFYFLTTENEELLIANTGEDFGAFDRALDDARRGIDNYQVGLHEKPSGKQPITFLFPGKPYRTWNTEHEEKIVLGTIKQQESLIW
jgi:hypothetical protein